MMYIEDEHWIDGYPTPIANPMSLYQTFRKSWGINARGSAVVEVSVRMSLPDSDLSDHCVYLLYRCVNWWSSCLLYH